MYIRPAKIFRYNNIRQFQWCINMVKIRPAFGRPTNVSFSNNVGFLRILTCIIWSTLSIYDTVNIRLSSYRY